jgi:anti-anti-sigma regulatory factor
MPAREPQPPSALHERNSAFAALQDFRSGFWWSSTPAAIDPTIVVGTAPDYEVELQEIAESEEEDVPIEFEQFWHVRHITLEGDFTFMSALRIEGIRELLLKMPGTKHDKIAHHRRVEDKHSQAKKEKVVLSASPVDATSVITTTIVTTTDTTVKERSRMRAIFDFTKVNRIDVSGAEILITALNDYKAENEGSSIILRGMNTATQNMLVSLDHSHTIEHALHDTDNIF